MSGLWRCSCCGEGVAPGEIVAPSWKRLGDWVLHHCQSADPAATGGFHPCRWFGEGDGLPGGDSTQEERMMAETAKYTPGPWELGGECQTALTFDREACIYPPSAGPGEYQYAGPIAVVGVGDDSGGLANARLIAAAPELLAALVQFVRMDDSAEEISGGRWNAAVVMARAAIATARGTATPE